MIFFLSKLNANAFHASLVCIMADYAHLPIKMPGQTVFNSLTAKSIPARTAKSVPAGTKNYRFVESLRRNSKFFFVVQNTKQPPTTPTMVIHLPLLRHGLDGCSKSNTQATRPRVCPRALLLGFVLNNKLAEKWINIILISS